MKYLKYVFRPLGLAALMSVSVAAGQAASVAAPMPVPFGCVYASAETFPDPCAARSSVPCFDPVTILDPVDSCDPVSCPDPVTYTENGLPQERAAELLRALSDRIRSLGRYAAAFTVEADGQTAAGYYTVVGDRYYLRLADAEVYCDGKARYEVDNRRKEVAVDRVDAASRNILDNPTRAFDLVDDGFASELLWERDGRAAVKLTPEAGQPLSAVTVTVDTRTMRPVSLEYDFDGERIRIAIRSIEAADEAPKSYDPAQYRTYETIDFR